MKNSSASQPYYSGSPACSPAAGYCGGYLDPSNYAAYAAYLEDFVTYFNAHSAFDLYAISMQNEPDYSAATGENYESCSWTAQQMDTWIAGNASVLTAKLIMPESFQFIQAQSNTALEDPKRGEPDQHYRWSPLWSFACPLPSRRAGRQRSLDDRARSDAIGIGSGHCRCPRFGRGGSQFHGHG